MTHVMLDLETFGTKPGSVLRSIGAVAFDPMGEGTGAEFYCNIDYVSCLEAGLTVDPATKDWWAKQPYEVEAALSLNPRRLPLVVDEFHAWFVTLRGEKIWSQGSNFDEPLWTAAARALHRHVPWKYWNARCTRTAYELAGFDPRSVVRAGDHHNALDDAKFQVRCVQAAMRRLREKAAA